jgi:hypothetical protein
MHAYLPTQDTICFVLTVLTGETMAILAVNGILMRRETCVQGHTTWQLCICVCPRVQMGGTYMWMGVGLDGGLPGNFGIVYAEQ